MGIEQQFKMAYTIKKLNSVIYRSTYSSRFISLFYGEIEKDGHLIFVNAGHPAPFLVSDTEVKDLKATGLILGALPEIQLHRSFAQIPPGGVLVLFSDGIFERENREEELFGLRRLKELVFQSRHNSAQEILEAIINTVGSFGPQNKWDDDVTLIIVKRHQA
jgi:sigma-B regulation protein RsbU (phosphoserine phosphatase)